MYPDRDFQPEDRFQPRGSLTAFETTLVEDLALGRLFNAMARKDEFLMPVVRQVVLNSLESPELIRYRQDVLKDCLEHPDLVRQLYSIPIKSLENKRRYWMGIFGSVPSTVLMGARGLLEMFVHLLTDLRQLADEHAAEFKSEGFRRFFDMIQKELDDEYLSAIAQHVKRLRFRKGVLLSASLGPGNEGSNYVLRKEQHDRRSWPLRLLAPRPPEYGFSLHPRDDSGARALENLRSRGLNQVANAVGQSADHIDGFLNTLRLELAFYMGCLNLAETLTRLKEPFTFPEPALPGERIHTVAGLYDVALALTTEMPVVGNQVAGDRKDLVFITGANQGGKSTFLRSIGLAQVMMQCGMFVAADSFRANVCRGLFTHFKREEDATMTSGKFDEELARMSAIVDKLQPDALLLLNESFAATNEREGSEIARQIVDALLEKRIKIIYVTHLHALARGFCDRNMPNALFLRAERGPDGSRSYKLIEGEPLQTSFGMDLYSRIFE